MRLEKKLPILPMPATRITKKALSLIIYRAQSAGSLSKTNFIKVVSKLAIRAVALHTINFFKLCTGATPIKHVKLLSVVYIFKKKWYLNFNR